MIDLTPLDVRKKRGDFRQKLRGYDPEEVDTFLELVEARMEDLVKENRSLKEKTTLLQSRVDSLEGRERAVQDALVSAQALRKEVQDQAKKDAMTLEDQARREIDLLRREVEARIEGRIREADELLKERQRALEELERNRRKFLKGFRSLLEREIDAVEVEEARRPLEDAPLDLELRGWKAEEVDEEIDEPTDDTPGAAGDPLQGSTQGPGAEPSAIREPASRGDTGSDLDSRQALTAEPEERREASPLPGPEEPDGPSLEEQPDLALGHDDSTGPGETEPERASARELLLGKEEEDESEESGRALPEPFWLSELLTRKRREGGDPVSSGNVEEPGEERTGPPGHDGEQEGDDLRPEGLSGGEVT